MKRQTEEILGLLQESWWEEEEGHLSKHELMVLRHWQEVDFTGAFVREIEVWAAFPGSVL